MFYVQVGVYRHVFHTPNGDVEVESTKLDADTVWRDLNCKNAMEEIIKYRQENPNAMSTTHTVSIEEYRQLFDALVEYGHEFKVYIEPKKNLAQVTIYKA